MNNNLTEIVFILDRSGSMAGLEEDTVGGFNAAIAEQKGKEGTALVSTVLFHHESAVLHDRVPIDRVSPMTRADYRVGGCTALLDAIGGAIHHIGNVHKYARPEDIPAHTVFLITTDGMENASGRYDLATVKAMIARQQERYGWEFVFLAANIDAAETAEGLGISRSRSANYDPDGEGVRVTYRAMCEAITSVRSGRSLDEEGWRRDLDRPDRERNAKNSKGGKKA